MAITPQDLGNIIVVVSYDKQLLPEPQTAGAYCADLQNDQDFSIEPGEVKLIDTWVKVAMPQGIVCKIYSRSSTPVKQWLTLANSVGIVDSDYRGEIKLQLHNITSKTISIPKNTRLCQLHFESSLFYTGPVPTIEYKEDEDLYNNFEHVYPTDRWTWWHGSTGK